jgi:hypothetical protein
LHGQNGGFSVELAEIGSVEFVGYPEVLPRLREHGLEEFEDPDGCVRLEMPATEGTRSLHVKAPTSHVVPYPEAEVFECDKEELAELVGQFLSRMYLSEVLIVPVSTWREIIDCVAYDLASDEDWLEMDAISAVHQNTRNALAVTRAETSVTVEMIRALLKNADSPRQDLCIVSEVTPLLVEVFHDGAVCVSCLEGVAEELARIVRK